MWVHVPGESRESVMMRLSARTGGTVSIVKFERAFNDTAAKSNQIFFSHVSKYLKDQDRFNDAVFLMKGVGINVLDEYGAPVADGEWDLHAQLDGKCLYIHYWAVHTDSGSHVAFTNVPKFSTFVHFSPCGHKFITMDISDEAEMNRCNINTSFYTTDVRGKRIWDSCDAHSP